MSEFRIPKVSTLIGSKMGNFLKVIREGKPDRKFWYKIFLTGLLVVISSPFHFWEWIRFNRKVRNFQFKEPPVFIIGHWRSGTTFLHNTLCQDPAAGFITTYQGLFPNNLASKWIFKSYMRLKMPDRRPADNMKLDINFPQEDEFAVGNLTTISYYHFFYFPRYYEKYYERATDFVEGSAQEKIWMKKYRELLIKASLNSGKDRLFIKNPVNTARIRTILKLFPNARFIYIKRNPIEVILSTRRFFHPLMPTLWLHSVNEKFIDQMIFETYRKLMDIYERDKGLIPANQLIEIEYNEFTDSPLSHLKEIHETLLQEPVDPKIETYKKYLSGLDRRKGKKYEISEQTYLEIKSQIGDYLKNYNISPITIRP
jgi:hypothetical protein